MTQKIKNEEILNIYQNAKKTNRSIAFLIQLYKKIVTHDGTSDLEYAIK